MHLVLVELPLRKTGAVGHISFGLLAFWVKEHVCWLSVLVFTFTDTQSKVSSNFEHGLGAFSHHLWYWLVAHLHMYLQTYSTDGELPVS